MDAEAIKEVENTLCFYRMRVLTCFYAI